MQTKNLHPNNYMLCVDSSTPTTALAILRGQEILYEVQVTTKAREKRSLLRLVDNALAETNLRIQDIERFVVSRGPGAFTSLRVSMALFKSFALSLDKPLYAASSLRALAFPYQHAQAVLCSCMDARRGELYCAFYRGESAGVEDLSEELLLSPEAYVDYIKTHHSGARLLFLGNGARAQRDRLVEAFGDLATFPVYEAKPSASALGAEILRDFPHEAPSVGLEALEPVYIRVESFALAKPFFSDT